LIELPPYLCPDCVAAIGRFARAGSRGSNEIWRSPPANTPRPVSPKPEHGYSVDEVFADFKADLDKVVALSDCETHLDLAIAYREMGLSSDALLEAAIALEHGSASLGKRAVEALRLLFDQQQLKLGLAETITRLRDALFPE
jgi:hypothetical protein